METILGLGLGMGFLVVSAIVALALYVFNAYTHMNALKALGYQNAWLAWIPYASYYACADAVSQGEEQVNMFNKVNVPVVVFKLWWIIPLVLGFLLEGKILTLAVRLLNIVFLGYSYTRMYARLEGKTEEETTALGCISGLFPIIAAIKFIGLK